MARATPSRARRSPRRSDAEPDYRAALLRDEVRYYPAPRYRRSDRLLILVYPNTYAVGMSSLGYLVVRRMVERAPGWRVERAFRPEGWRTGAPRTLDSGLPLGEADVLAFSLSCETDAPIIARLLRGSGIPLPARERDDSHPLILVGGGAVSLNPEPLARIADLVLVGEAEGALEPLLAILAEDGSREARLERCAALAGVYVPSLYEEQAGEGGSVVPTPAAPGALFPVTAAQCGQLDLHPTFSDITTPNTEFADLRLIEIARGCPRGCRFCVVPRHHGAARFRSVGSVLSLAEGAGRVGLLGAAASDHPDLAQMVGALADRGHGVTLSASRSDVLSREVVEALARAGQRTLTLAPESPEDAVRLAAGKNVSLDRVVEVAGWAGDAGFAVVKLYFILGLPGSSEDEGGRIARLAADVAAAARPARVTVSAGPLVPKPQTPFESLPFPDSAAMTDRLERLDKALRRRGRNVEYRPASVRYAEMEATISRGDRRLADAMAAYAAARGDTPAAWSLALETAGLSFRELLDGPVVGRRERPWRIVAPPPETE